MQAFRSFLVEYASGSFEPVVYPQWNPYDEDGPSGYSETTSPDNFLYHVTLADVAKRILASQELKKGKTLMGKNMTSNSKGRVFLTDKSGVNFWYEKAWWHAVGTGKYNTSNPSIVVLRVPKRIVPNVMPDDIGTREAGAPAWYVTGGFSLRA